MKSLVETIIGKFHMVKSFENRYCEKENGIEQLGLKGVTCTLSNTLNIPYREHQISCEIKMFSNDVILVVCPKVTKDDIKCLHILIRFGRPVTASELSEANVLLRKHIEFLINEFGASIYVSNLETTTEIFLSGIDKQYFVPSAYENLIHDLTYSNGINEILVRDTKSEFYPVLFNRLMS